MSGDDRARRAARNLARHLDERHPDTVLFLARHAAGRPEAVTASLLSVDDAGITLTVDGADEPLRVVFPPAAGPAPDPRARLRQLLLSTRAARPGGPLTSLEELVAESGRH